MRRAVLAFMALLALVAISGCRWYTGVSPFYATVPTNPAVAPNSSLQISHLLDYGSANIQWQAYSTTLVPADADTPHYSVQLMAGYAQPGHSYLDGVPIPDGAQHDPSSDGHMSVFDQSTGCVYDFWRADLSDPAHPKAAWANRMQASEDGVYDKGASARGSGFANLEGLMTPDEFTNLIGIDHALAFNYHANKSGGPVAPATESDGSSSVSWAIPEGARLFLPRSFDLLPYAPWVRAIGKALREYGAYDVDNGGQSPMGFYAINPRGNGQDQTPYPWGSTAYPTLPDGLMRALRVEQYGAQQPSQFQPVSSPCGSYR